MKTDDNTNSAESSVDALLPPPQPRLPDGSRGAFLAIDGETTPPRGRHAAGRTAGLSSEDVLAARKRLRGVVRTTPCFASRALGESIHARVFLKHEQRQPTGSFKERGAANALLRLSGDERARGVIAASAGNHALGLAYHGARLGVRVTLVMQRGAARVKVGRCRALGAEVVEIGASFEDAEEEARARAGREGFHFVHPFDDPVVMAGQGTLGLEILEQVRDLDAVVVPVGGGGLLAGLCVAIKSVQPRVRIIVVEPEHASSYTTSWRSGQVERVAVKPTLADGLAVARVGARAFEVSHRFVDAAVTVSETEIARAMRWLDEHENVVVEGAGATGVAALLAGKLDLVGMQNIVIPLTGGNVDKRKPMDYSKARR